MDERLDPATAERARSLLAVVILGVVAVGTIGHVADVDGLIRWRQDLPALTPAVLVLFAFVGVALLPVGPVGDLLAGIVLAAAVVTLAARALEFHLPFEDLDLVTSGGAGSRPSLPAPATLVGLLLVAAGILLRRRPWLLGAAGLAVGVVAVLNVTAFLYGDDQAVVATSSLPDSAVPLPSTVMLIAAAVAMLLLRPSDGVIGWLLADTRPRAEFRRLAPIIALTPLVVAGIVQWTGLVDHLGEPRAWAVTAVALALAAVGIVVVGVTRVDGLDARMRALELENLAAAEDRRAARRSRLAADLAAATTVEELWQAIGEGAALPVEGAVANIAVIEGERVVTKPHDPGREGADERMAELAVADRAPYLEALRTLSPVLLGDAQECERRFPDLAGPMAEAGIGAAAFVPVFDAYDRPRGALGIGWDHPVTFTAAIVNELRTVAEVCGQALERASLYDVEHQLIGALQERILVDVPAVSDLEVHAHYQPAVSGLGIGGDWYEGIVDDRGRLVVVIGDVAGHGVAAAADMARLRAAISTLVRAGTPLELVFDLATSSLRADGDLDSPIATAAAAVLDVGAGAVHYVSAGHPPLMLRRADGSVEVLSGGRRPLIGVEAPPVRAASAPLEPGSILVAYTDGLVERRGELIDDSLDRLAEALRDAPDRDPATVGRHLLDRCLSGTRPDDDVALVVVRWGQAT